MTVFCARLGNRLSCTLQHAAPVGRTEGQGLGLRRGLDESSLKGKRYEGSLEAALGMQPERVCVAVYLPLYDDSWIATQQAPISLF